MAFSARWPAIFLPVCTEEEDRGGAQNPLHTKNIDSYGAPPFNLFAPFHLNDVLVHQGERERCNSAKERGKRKVQGGRRGLDTPPQGARQPSSGWALWYILPIFHAHPSWCDPTQGLLCFWQLCAGKHAAALIAWNREQRPPGRGEGATEARCAPVPPGSGHKQMLGRPRLSLPPERGGPVGEMGLKCIVLGLL